MAGVALMPLIICCGSGGRAISCLLQIPKGSELNGRALGEISSLISSSDGFAMIRASTNGKSDIDVAFAAKTSLSKERPAGSV